MKETDTDGKPVRSRGRRNGHEIDENLKRVYEDMIDDTVPERFLALLDQLRAEGKDR